MICRKFQEDKAFRRVVLVVGGMGGVRVVSGSPVASCFVLVLIQLLLVKGYFRRPYREKKS